MRLWPRALAVTVLLAGAHHGCVRQARVAQWCSTDRDCRGDRVCVQHACLSPPQAAVPDESPQIVADPGPDRSGQANEARPLAFAMFGGNPQHTGALAGPAPATAPTPLWLIRAEQAIVGSPTVGPGGTIFFTSHDGNLYAADPAGRFLWTFATKDRVWSTPAVAEDGTVYIGSDDDHIYAVDGASGAEKWRFRIGLCEPPIGFGPEGSRCDGDGGPTLGEDGTVYSGGDGVYAIWPDGTLRWKFATAEHVATAPAVGRNGIVYAGSHDDALYAIRPDGTKEWEFRIGADIDSSPAVGPDGAVYFGGDDGAIYALHADGTLRWKVLTAGPVRSSPAIGRDGTIYVGSYDGMLYAIAPNGAVRWRFSAADKVHAPVAISTDGVILVGSQDDHLYAVSADGKLRWYIAFDDDVDAAPAISTEGILYVASDDRTLRAYR